MRRIRWHYTSQPEDHVDDVTSIETDMYLDHTSAKFRLDLTGLQGPRSLQRGLSQ